MVLWSNSTFFDTGCGNNAQHCLITLIEKWKESVDNGGAFGALLTDLWKAFDSLSHVLIGKLNAYGFYKRSLKLTHGYLSHRKQRVKINEKYSSWSDMLFGVRVLLGPLLFNIFMCNVFLF